MTGENSPLGQMGHHNAPDTGAGAFRLIACSLNVERRTDRYFESGKNLGVCLREIGWQPDGMSARVTIDGELIPDAQWLTTEPKPGQSVVVRKFPTGMGKGSGGREGKMVLQLVGMIGLAISAAFTGGGSLAALGPMLGMGAGALAGGSIGANIASAVILLGGSLFMNAFVPPPLPRRLEKL